MGDRIQLGKWAKRELHVGRGGRLREGTREKGRYEEGSGREGRKVWEGSGREWS